MSLRLPTSFYHQMRCNIDLASSRVLGCLAIFVVSFSPVQATEAIGSSPIVSLFNTNRFPEALAACERAIKEHPLDANLRYWHASILVKLQRSAEAHQEFEYVYTYSKNRTERDYALKACQLLEASAGSSALTAGAQGQAQTSALQPAPASKNPAAERISRQADADSTNILIDGTRRQNYLTTKAEYDANNAANLQSVDAMSRATIQIGNKSVPRYTPDEIQFARNQAIDRANQVRAQSTARANEALQLAQQKAFETQASAANLAAQFNSGSKTGFHLREEGTNLYVRQYNAPEPNSTNSLNPAMVSIDDSANAARGKFDVPMQAAAKALDPVVQKQLDDEAKKNVHSNVYGHLFPKPPTDLQELNSQKH